MAFSNARNSTLINCSFTEHINTYQNSALVALQFNQIATAVGAAYNSEERHPHPRCLPRTRVDSIQNIKEWADVGISKILWLHGPAGAGKSAVAQTICETWADAGLLLASFFFSRTVSTRNTIERFVATIASQCIQTLVGHLDPILSVIEKNPHILRQDVQAQLDKLFIGPVEQAFKLFAKRSGQKRPSFIVIDAVDECSGSENQLRLLSLILTLVDPKHSLPVRFLIVSRPESHLRHAFSTLLNSVSTVESLYGALEDVHKYLDFKFTEIHDSEKHSEIMRYVPKPWPGPEVLRELTTRSGGYFIYAATVVRHVDEEGYICTDRLEEVLNKDARALGSYPYRELDKVYSQVLSTARNIHSLLRILACIIVGRRTLVSYDSLAPNVSTSTLISALFSLRQGELKTILRGLHSIISLSDGDTDDLRFYHASFSDFLLDKERSEEYHIDGDAAIEDMHKASLSLIRIPSTPQPFVPTSDWAVAVMCWSRLGLPAELLYGQVVDNSIMASLGALIRRSKDWNEDIQFRLICLLCGMILLLKEFVLATAVIQTLLQLSRTALALSFSPEQNMKGLECIQDVRTLLGMEHYKNRSWQFQRANLRGVLRLSSSEKPPVDRFLSYLSYTRDQFFHRTEFSVVTNLEAGTWQDSRSILNEIIESFLNDTTMWGEACQQKEREIRVNKRLIGSTKWEEIQRGDTLRRSTSWTNLRTPIDVTLEDTSGHFLLGSPQQARRVDNSDSDDEAPWAKNDVAGKDFPLDWVSIRSADNWPNWPKERGARQEVNHGQLNHEQHGLDDPENISFPVSSPSRECSNCRTHHTPLWRRHMKTDALLCNACGLYHKLHGADRPLYRLASNQPENVSLPVSSPSLECSDCHTHHTYVWRRHTKTDALLCNACGIYHKLRETDRPLRVATRRGKLSTSESRT